MKNKVKAFFNKNPGARLKAKEISRLLDFAEAHEYAKLKQVLHDLEREGFLFRVGKRYLLDTKTAEGFTGLLQMSERGDYGFVVTKGRGFSDIFIPQRYLGTALHGDRVEVSLLARKKGKNIEGEITKVIERSSKEIRGVLHKSGSFYFVRPDEKRIQRDIYISSRELQGAKDGDKVMVADIYWEDGHLNPEGRITEVIGKAGSYDTELRAIAKEFKLSLRFPDEVLKEVDNISGDISNEEISQRLDLRDENIFTIDPDTAKDFDDAVSIKTDHEGNYQVGIHIADVAHYATPDTKVYKEALKRATSVYFVGNVIPMLPEKLSNNLCSLVPGEDRLAFSVIVKMTPRGKVLDSLITKSVINSKRRFTYNEALEILESGEGDFHEELNRLNKLATVLRKKRFRKGSINFSTPELEFKLDENGNTIEINVTREDDSHRLIEELMLLANRIVAETLSKKRVPLIYRVHDEPDKLKLEEFASFVKTMGYSFDPSGRNSSGQFQHLFDQIGDAPEKNLVHEVAIRSMAKAVYSDFNIGHYGLAFDHYCHFTSPIRRFPDLVVHLILWEYLKTGKLRTFTQNELTYISDHSSNKERSAVDAERKSVKIKQLEFLRNKIGYDYTGVISGITHFGMFIQIKENLAEGLLRLSDMDDDFYIFDEKRYSLTGEHKGKVYRLADEVNVKIARVDREKKEIDFILLD